MGNNNQFVPVADIDFVPNAVRNLPLLPDDSRYIDCAKIRGSDTVKIIERKLLRPEKGYQHLLFSGYRGTGKTTELFQLQARFQKDYEVFYYDASAELDLFNCKMPDMLMAIAKETYVHMNKAGYSLSGKILKDVADWFFEKVLEKEQSIAAEAGGRAEISSPKWFTFITAKIFSVMKLETKDREIMRRKLENNLSGLIEKINVLLQNAEKQVKAHGKKGLIFMIDSLDRLRQGIDKELFFANGSFFKQLNGNFIFVVPISLLYDEQASLLDFDYEILPMIPIFKSDTDHIPNETNIQLLKDLIGKRIVVDAIFTNPEENLKELILTSGGHLRDLMKLIHYACYETDEQIKPKHVKIAMNKLMGIYDKVVRDDQYQHLVKIYANQVAPNDTLNQKLIYNNVILVYRQEDGTEWKDVHPAVVMNKKFQKALKG
jgi:hypothetical protein